MIGLIISLLVLAIDQVSKRLVYGMPARSIIGNLLWFESTLNKGVAFGMFAGMQIIFIVLASSCSGFFVYLLISKKIIRQKKMKVAIGLILGGTISNMIDRLIFNGVRDFIYLRFINFAIFNVADMAITIGTILIVIYILFGRSEKNEVKS